MPSMVLVLVNANINCPMFSTYFPVTRIGASSFELYEKDEVLTVHKEQDLGSWHIN
jgi:hypothetical protein